MVLKTKIAAIVLVSMVVVVSVTAYMMLKDDDHVYEKGIIIDFGDYTGDWIALESSSENGRVVVEAACELKDYELVFDGEKVQSVNGVAASGGKTWDLWTWSFDSGWTKAGDPSSVTIQDDIYVALALTSTGKSPLLPCVDALGNNIFSVTNTNIVSLSSVSTEILCALDNIDALLAVDEFSNYPDDPRLDAVRQNWGWYYPPEIESVASFNPDLVIGDEDVHDGLLGSLIDADIRAISLYTAYTLEVVYKNIWMIGAVTGQIGLANELIADMRDKLDDITTSDEAAIFEGKTVMILFGNEWYQSGIGCNTFIYDVISRIGVINLMDDPSLGWIMDLEDIVAAGIPDIVIFIADEDIDSTKIRDMIHDNGLQAWPIIGPDPWDGVDLYLLDGTYGDMFMRAGPRIVDALEALVNSTPV